MSGQRELEESIARRRDEFDPNFLTISHQQSG